MTKSRIIFLLAISILFVTTSESCGPDFPALTFTRPHGPDGPVSVFTKGKIGIPLPTWWRAYLVVAYRYLENKPLSQEESDSFARFWGTERKMSPSEHAVDAPIENWIQARARYYSLKPGKEITAYKEAGYSYQFNCGASAFNTAAETLKARAKHFGAKSQELREWIEGQDAVFENCSSKEAILPPALPEHADPLLQTDRAYQTAAIYFYSGNYPHAIADFDTISRDATSPWQSIAPYLAARAILRQVPDNDDLPKEERGNKDKSVAFMKDAKQRLEAVLNDPSRKQWHHDAQRLLNWIAYRTEPLQYQHRLAKEITSGHADSDFGQDVKDYTLLLDQYLENEPDFQGVEHYGEEYDRKLAQWRQEQYKTLQGERADNLSDWIITFQSNSDEARQHAVNKWQATRSNPWLYLALAKLKGTNAASSAAIQAAAKINQDSPFFAALNYHSARLLREKGDIAGARAVMEKLLAVQQNVSLSTLNLIRDEQMRLAQTLPQFTAQMVRQPVRLNYGDMDYGEDNDGCYYADCNLVFYGTAKPSKHTPLAIQFDYTTGLLLNTRIPTVALVDILNQKTLPEPLQHRLVLAVWARTILLDQPDLTAKISEEAIAEEPKLKIYVQELTQAKSPEERKFVAAFAIAHFPGLRPFVDSVYPRDTKFEKIDNYRDNWWCSDVGGIADQPSYSKEYGKPKIPSLDYSPAFLTEEQSQQGKAEWKNLHGIGAAEEYLPSVLIRWARTHPDDLRVPEALHFSWRVSRYACSKEGAHDYNREAFKLLHKNYPQSEWTKKTKIWY